MKTQKEIKITESNINIYINEGLIKKGDYEYLTEFYLKTAKKTLQTSDALMQISENNELKKKLGLLDDFETYLWVITSAYYSMFYIVNALFSKKGIKIGDKVVHKVASDAFYFYFIKNKKIAKELFEIYEEAKGQAMDLIRYSEQAEKLFQDLEYERGKRHRFQYNMTESIKKSYAQTSLKRAKDFINEIELLIK
ncbi:MAG TPA: hypothetical protein VMZ91_01145 [Candidatus Paceibacterota bacterium]|nr:hypothetical protein [Candidatus Paceibacterota bacterium]